MENKREIYEYIGRVASSDSVSHHGTKGMKWGKRRYQNEDGTLTDLGKIRYRAGLTKGLEPNTPKKDEPKKDEPKKDESKKDEPKKDEPKKDEPKKDEPKKDEPKKDAKATVENLRKAADKQKFEDQINTIQSTRNVLDSSAKLSKNLKDASDESIRNAPKVRLNLDNMSDAELRNAINREQLERQYNDYFAPSTVSKGQKTVNQMLGAITTGLTVAGSALSVAIAIRQLLNK